MGRAEGKGRPYTEFFSSLKQETRPMERYISGSAKIGEGFKCGYGVIIHESVNLGENIEIGNYVIVHPSTVIGSGTVIQDHAVLGKPPKLSSTSTVKIDDLPPLNVGENCSIGTASVLLAGTSVSEDVTIGDGVFVREKCSVGSHTVLGRGVVVENKSSIGTNCKIQTGAYITAETVIEDGVFVGPMAITTNDNFMGRTKKRFALKKGPRIKKSARIGAGAIILPGLTIGEEAFVAAGSVVTKDVPDRKLVMGVPARLVRDVPEEELLK
jgi:acetyltransferase-like isoleucine patch superfamily enzyme